MSIAGKEEADSLARAACKVTAPVGPNMVKRAQCQVKKIVHNSMIRRRQTVAPLRYKKLGLSSCQIGPAELQILRTALTTTLLVATTGHGDFVWNHRHFNHMNTALTYPHGCEQKTIQYTFCAALRFIRRTVGDNQPKPVFDNCYTYARTGTSLYTPHLQSTRTTKKY